MCLLCMKSVLSELQQHKASFVEKKISKTDIEEIGHSILLLIIDRATRSVVI